MRPTTRLGWAIGPASLVAGVGLALSVPTPAPADPTLAPLTTPEARQAIDTAEALSDAFANVAEAIEPGVVSIRSTDEVLVRPRSRFPQLPDEFRRFFGDDPFLPFGRPDPQPQRRYRQGQGSGFVYSADGYIITNNHVVAGADDVVVVLTDGREYTARIVGTDPQTDVAVLRIDATGLTPIPVGDSDTLRVGQWVVAAGSPFGLTSTITTGVISATQRQRVGINDYEDFIQTDAAINPGNSGGPLVNLRGEVIGVNSAIATRSGGNNGVGFAIPINLVTSVADTLIADGRVTRGVIGVTIQDLTPELAQSFQYDSTNGALVSDVTPGGPADQAGFKPGDILTAVNGQPVHTAAGLRLRVGEFEPGETIRVTVFRDGQTLTLRPTIAPSDQASPLADASAADTLGDRLGAEFATLTPDLAARARLDNDLKGVLVTSIDPTGLAARAGLRPGDAVTAVNGRPVESAAALHEALSPDRLREGVRLTVRSAGGARFVFIRLTG